MEKKTEDTFFIDTWFMSCRVLRRGMEEFIINTMVETAVRNGCKTLIGEYLPTAKNAMVKDIYPQHGFAETEEYRYALDCTMYQPTAVYISKKEVME